MIECIKQNVKRLLLGFIKLSIAYSLCLFYSALTLAFIAFNYITKYNSDYLIVKDRPVPPKILSNPKFGQHKFVTVNGVKLHYVQKGDTSKPLMLFVHGFPEFWYSWRHQIEEFSKDYWTVALDMRGYGDSEKPSGVSHYDIKHLTNDIKALITELGHEKCVLVCHDWGAVVGWNFITNHMDMVSKYIMMGAPSSLAWRITMISDWDQFKKSWYIFFFQMPKIPEFTLRLNDLKVMSNLGTGPESTALTEEELEAFKYTFAKPGAFTPPINYYRANLKFFESSKPTRPTTFSPGLYLLGEHDFFISKSTGPLLKKQFQNLQFEVVPGANHFVQQDAPDKTNALMRQFLRT